MKRSNLLRCLVPVLFAVVCWQLLRTALDVPTQTLGENVLVTLRATGGLLLLAGGSLLLRGRGVRIGIVDLLAAAIFAGITLYRAVAPDSVSRLRYDELLQAAMLYVALRVLLSDRRNAALLLSVLFLLGIYEAAVGFRQVYGLASSNHGLFRLTGTFFNPGPYAGFLAPAFICAAAWIIRRHRTVLRVLQSRSLRRRPGTLLHSVVPYALGWICVVTTAVILPATMSRAAAMAVMASLCCLLLREFRVFGHLRERFASQPVRTSVFIIAAPVLSALFAAGVYHVKQPSADGRLLMWKIDTRILLRHPWCGVGPGNFAGAFGREQAAYFAAEERSPQERSVAGCPESGFNEFLQFGAETGVAGAVLLLSLTVAAVMGAVRRRSAFGYGVLGAAVFACFSYPWSVLPLRLLFVVLLAASAQGGVAGRGFRGSLPVLVISMLFGACWPGLYDRYSARVEAQREWSDVRLWLDSERYDYLVEDGNRLYPVLQEDFRFLYDYGYALHKTGDYRRSNEVLRRGMQLSSDPMFRNIAAKNYEAQGDYVSAEKELLQAHAMIPHRLYPLYLLARLYVSAGRQQEARAVIVRALGLKLKIESVQTREMRNELRALLGTIEPSNSLPEKRCKN